MRKEDIKFLFEKLWKLYWDIGTELHYSTPFQLITAVVLSAQCTDKRVNLITPSLWEKYPDAKKMAQSSQEEIFLFIKSCSYPNNKAKSLFWLSNKLVNNFNCVVPKSLDDLQTLPGVGLKTAKVVSHVLYDNPVIAVDTHVFRVVNRLWLVKESSRDKTSELLEKIIPDEYKSIAHHSLIYFGRYHCTARKPKCDECLFIHFCSYYDKHERADSMRKSR